MGQQVYPGLRPGEITQVAASRDYTPAMTANDAPSPLVASAGSEASGHEAYKALDDSVTTYWSPSSGATGWVKIDMGVGRSVQRYSLAVPAPVYAEDIEAISRANPAVITMTGHGLATGNYVYISGITQTGWTFLNTGLSSNNSAWPITKVNDNFFSVLFDSRGASAIEAASRATACVITLANHRLTVGTIRSVVIAGITQADWTALNGTRTATVIDANTFSVAVNTSAYGLAYDAGTDPGTVDTSGINAADYVPATDAGTIALRYDPSAWTFEGSNYDQSLTPVDIEGMTRANPCVVTWTGHGMESGQFVTFSGITQADWTALNARHAVTYISPDSFSIAVDTSGYAGDYVAGTDPGTVVHSDWTTLDTQSNQYLLSSTPKDYPIASPESCRYYKLTVSAGLGPSLQLAEMAFQLLENYLQVLGLALSATQIEFSPNLLEIGVA